MDIFAPANCNILIVIRATINLHASILALHFYDKTAYNCAAHSCTWNSCSITIIRDIRKITKSCISLYLRENGHNGNCLAHKELPTYIFVFWKVSSKIAEMLNMRSWALVKPFTGKRYLNDIAAVLVHLLPHGGLMMPHGDIDLDQHCLRNGFLPDDTKPSPELMLTNQWGFVAFTSGNVHAIC